MLLHPTQDASTRHTKGPDLRQLPDSHPDDTPERAPNSLQGVRPPPATRHEASARLAAVDLAALLAAARAGDRDSAGELYRRFQPVILACQLRNTAGDLHLAWDLTQETFVRGLHRLDRFTWQGPTSLRRWLLTIARNVFLDHVRSAAQQRHGGYDVPDQQDDSDLNDPERLALRALDHTRQLVRWSLNQLTDDQRLVLQRTVGEGYRAAEVAEELGRTPAAVRQLRHRALQAARRQLGPTGDGHTGGALDALLWWPADEPEPDQSSNDALSALLHEFSTGSRYQR